MNEASKTNEETTHETSRHATGTDQKAAGSEYHQPENSSKTTGETDSTTQKMKEENMADPQTNPIAETQSESGTAPENEPESSSEEDQLTLEETLTLRVRELETDVKSLQDQQLRRAAETENMRKRLQRERVQLYEKSRIDAIESFLPIYDDLIRTLASMENSDTESPYFEGVQMVVTKFNDVLTQAGLSRIDQTGVPFNVDEHDAMLRQKAPDETIESDTVLQVLESGYRVGDRTIRHAKVIVSE